MIHDRPHLWRLRYRINAPYDNRAPYEQPIDVWAFSAEDAVLIANRRAGKYGLWSYGPDSIKPWISLQTLTSETV